MLANSQDFVLKIGCLQVAQLFSSQSVFVERMTFMLAELEILKINMVITDSASESCHIWHGKLFAAVVFYKE